MDPALTFLRAFVLAGCLLLTCCAGRSQDSPDPAQTPTAAEPSAPNVAAPTPVSFEITGTVRSGKTPLPGVSVTATNTLTGKKFAVATEANGTYTLTGLPRGRYVVRVEFMGFAVQTQEVVLKPETPSGKFDAEMVLASRQQEQTNNATAALVAAGRGFQSLALNNTLSALAGGGANGALGGGQGAGDAGGLPLNGAGAEGPTESVSITGAQGRTQDFGNGSEQDLQDRIQEFRDRMRESGQGGGPGGGGPAGIMGGGPIMMRLPRNLNINQPHGIFYVSDDNATFDARPYSLAGIQSERATYNLARFGANVGGPLNIPKIFNGGAKWFFFGGWNGTRGSTPYDAFSTVPTLAERAGDFSAATTRNGTLVQLTNPAGSQFQTGGAPCISANIINPACINSSAEVLLKFFPLPNVNAATQNFHYVTSDQNNSDNVSLRLIHNLGSASGPGFGPFGGGGPGGGGGGGQRRSSNNINFGLNWSRSSTDIINPFPSLQGGNSTQGLNASAGWTYGHGRATNNFRVNYNHNHVATTNLYSTSQDVAAEAGIGGVSTVPFDWGLPGISFSTFGGLSDPIPRRELDQTYTVSDTISWNRGRHNWRFGGDYRRILQSFRSAKNAEGSFVFTGFQTGYDFADFLLGLPQQTTLQSGVDSYNFRANSFDFFAQDDFRFRPSLSFNLGLRYEYNGPYTEASNRIANLDVTPGFASATPVVAGASASGLPPSLIRPDRNNFAPRIGIAWRPRQGTVIRTGYGINYNLAQYATIIQNFAFQPPFAITATNVSSPTSLLTLQNGFPAISAGAVTNNFAVDPNYRLGYVQVWNLDVQHEFAGNIVVNVDYNGSKGTRLDIERALDLGNLQRFTYESSAGNSIFQAGSIRIRKRFSKGFGLSGTYVYSKSIDDASSVGGGAVVVVQNPFDIAADRGLSAFDQRHKFTGNWIMDLPFGENHRFAQKGAWAHVLGGWQWSGDFTIASGLPFTPHVLGNGVDIGRGVSGSIRANLVAGQPIGLSDPTTREWFNTAAFCSPELTPNSTSNPNSTPTCANPNGTSFGDAGRNIIEGPGQITVDSSLNKTFTIKESRALEFRIQASNIFNTVQYTGINTVVNSLTFGEVTSAGNMRRLTFLVRFRF